MTFNPNLPHQWVDGVGINLTPQEIIDHEALQAQWAAEKAAQPGPPPDLATQLAAALIAKGVISETDIDSETLAILNQRIGIALII